MSAPFRTTTARAAPAVSSTRPPLALIVPLLLLLTSDLSGLPVATSITVDAILKRMLSLARQSNLIRASGVRMGYADFRDPDQDPR
jgi:hypothetical protein